MKRLFLVCAVTMLCACDKETDPVYDAHLFLQLQAQSWVLDSARITDSLGVDSFRYATDTVKEITQFNSQQYLINNVRVADSMTIDTIANQVIYDNPKRIYYYDQVSQQVIRNQYLDIDTVNAERLILTKMDTLKSVTRSFYHAH